jgi:hypothetical protein
MKIDGPVRIGFNPDFAPFSHVVNGAPSGIILERLMGVFQAAEIEYELEQTKLTKLVSDLMAGRLDALAALAITPSRLETLSFTKPVITSGAAWFTLANNELFVDGGIPKSVITPRVGPLVRQTRSLFPEIDLKICSDYDAALDAVIDGHAEAAALNWHVGRMLTNEKYKSIFHSPKAPFNTIPLAIATKADDPLKIINRLNEYIADEWGYDPL